MKLTVIIISIILVVLCAVGWLTMASQNAGAEQARDSRLAVAEDCMAKGLYQRAAENYLAALDGSPDEDIYVRVANAYSLRYAEAPKDTLDTYADFLETALASFPGNEELLEDFLTLYVDENGNTQSPKTVYPVVRAAVDAGINDEALLELLTRTRYAHSLRSNAYEAVVDSGNGVYQVRTDRGWNLYGTTGGIMLSDYYDYVGPCGDDSVTVTAGTDSRLFNAESAFVMGIFSDDVTRAGVWSEGTVPVLIDGSWSFYDEYANPMFGGFDYAGTFQDGLAPVEKDGVWMLVDKNGNSASDKFDEIVLDMAGRYKTGGFIIVRENGGYVVYDDDWEKQAELSCDLVDIRTEDGLIAFKKGEKWGFADMDGNVILEPIYDGAKSFSNGLAAVQNESGRWGFIDKNGRLAVDFEYTDAGYFDDNGFCPVRLPVDDGEDSGQAADKEKEQWSFLSLTLGIMEDQT